MENELALVDDWRKGAVARIKNVFTADALLSNALEASGLVPTWRGCPILIKEWLHSIYIICFLYKVIVLFTLSFLFHNVPFFMGAF